MADDRTVAVEWLETEDSEERAKKAAELLADGVYAYLSEQGFLKDLSKSQQAEETSPTDADFLSLHNMNTGN